jgi:hypothetical protein
MEDGFVTADLRYDKDGRRLPPTRVGGADMFGGIADFAGQYVGNIGNGLAYPFRAAGRAISGAVGSALGSGAQALSPYGSLRAQWEATQASQNVPEVDGLPPSPRESLIPATEPLAIERAISRPAPDDLSGLRGNQFQGRPSFNSGIGGAGATASQLEQDTRARGLLEAKYAMESDATDAEAARRGNPLADQIAGLTAERQFESLKPYGSTSKIGASFGSGWGDLSGSEVGSDVVGEEPIGGPTVGEAKAQQQAEVQSLFKNAPQMRELQMRANAMEKLRRLPQIRESLVARGVPPEQIDAQMAQEERRIMLELTAASGKDLGLFEMGG